MLEGKTIRLRAWLDGDLERMMQLRNDVETQVALVAQPRPNTASRVQRWVEARSGEPTTAFFIVADVKTDNLLGFAEVRDIHPLHRNGWLGMCLLPDARGKGAARESLELLENYVLDVFNLHKVLLDVLADNEPAVGLYRKAGYREVGVLRDHFFAHGHLRDALIMEKMLAAGEVSP